MVAWSIWKKRNTKLWENIHEHVEKVVCRAQGVINAWQNARSYTHVRPASNLQLQQQQIRWRPPPTEFLKCNVDAA
ncbi:putative non-LTR retroelement reverse transcriptase, partial [Trifolium medium]|nr:putative non-LTR retroelement reverse transcriptase [Trifolium medium]